MFAFFEPSLNKNTFADFCRRPFHCYFTILFSACNLFNGWVFVLIVDTMRKSQKFRVDTNYKQYFLYHTNTHTHAHACSDAVVHLKQTADEYCSFFKPPLVFSRLRFNPHPSLLLSTAPALITPFHVLGHPYWFTLIFLGTFIFLHPSHVLPLSLFQSELRGETLRDVVCRRSGLLEYCQTQVFTVKQRISAVVAAWD